LDITLNMSNFNSTIRQKKAKCTHPGCDYFGPVTKNLCPSHYWGGVRMKSAKKSDDKDKEAEDTESVAILKKDADLLFSRVVRLRAAAPGTGMCQCFICGADVHYSQAHAMHYVNREDSLVRLHPKNVRVGDKNCNIYLDGNLKLFAERLDEEEKRLSEWLYLEGNKVYKFTRDELKRLCADYTREINHLRKVKNLR